MRVAVVGAGMAGLAAARTLADADHDVVVLEADATCGGRIRTLVDGPWRVDVGAAFGLKQYQEVRRIVERAGLGDDVLNMKTTTAWVKPDLSLYRARATSPLAALRHPSVSLRDKARLGVALGWARLRSRTGDVREPASVAALDDGTSLAEWAARHNLAGATDHLLASVFWSLSLNDAHSVPWWYPPVVLTDLSSPPWTLRGGMGRIPEALARGLQVHRSVRVRRVRHRRTTVLVSTDGSHGRSELECDAAVMATPADVSRHLLGDDLTHAVGSAMADLVRGTFYRRFLLAALRYERSPEPSSYGVLFPPSTRPCGLAALGWEQHKERERAPAGAGHALVLTEPALADRLWSEPDDQVIMTLEARLKRLYPSAGPVLAGSVVHRWPRAMPRQAPGLVRDLAEALAAPHPGQRVWLAGDYLAGGSMELAAISGIRAARALLRAVPSQQPTAGPAGDYPSEETAGPSHRWQPTNT